MTTTHKTRIRSRCIMVVTSHPFAALRMQAGLRALPNCNISFVFDRVEALLLVRLQPPDLLILDYSLDGVKNLELAETFKHICPETAIITLMAKGNYENRQQVAELCTGHVLEKPVSFPVLYQVALSALAGVTKQ